jgi:hypothetical protein
VAAWRVEILSETVAAELAALPADMQARFLRLAERIASAGLHSLGEPHAKHLEGKLWELRLIGRDGIARALYVTVMGGGSSWCAPSSRKAGERRAPRSSSRCVGPGRSCDYSIRRTEGSSADEPRG